MEGKEIPQAETENRRLRSDGNFSGILTVFTNQILSKNGD